VSLCQYSHQLILTSSQVPEDAKWLNEEERAYVKSRLAADQGEAALERHVTMKDVGTAFKDIKLFLGG